MSEVEIRETLPADLDRLADVLVQVHSADGYPVEGVENPKAWLVLDKPIGQWTAILDGAPVGHVALSTPKAWGGAAGMLIKNEAIPTTQIAEIGRLFVSLDARGRGVAHRLMQVAEREAAGAGMVAVLEVMKKDLAAIALYQSRGWRVVGEFAHTFGNQAVEPALAMVASDQGPGRAKD